MVATQVQIRRLFREMARHAQIGVAAQRAGIDRKTARRYLRGGANLRQEQPVRSWRTRSDPFDAVRDEIEELLQADSGLQAKTIFEELKRRHPDRFQDGQLRSLQRAVRRWRALSGDAREVFFSQLHRPGEAMQTDFTSANDLGVTLAGEAFPHLLCHSILPYSNWQSATVCFSESLAALRDGIQTAFWRLGAVPQVHQTDNSTSATHTLKTKKRGFNDAYLALMQHYQVQPRTIAIGRSEQNGSVEAQNGALKRALDQRLRLRGSRDFSSRETYEAWLRSSLDEMNRARSVRLAEEHAVMRELPEAPLPAYVDEEARVTSSATIRVKGNTYSVPSQLIGERVQVRLYEHRLEVSFAQKVLLTVERLVGEGRHKIQYRHIIHSLVRKPFAFQRYRYREDLFPSSVFRRAHEVLGRELPERRADLEYLRLLKLAADTLESEVEAAIASVLAEGAAPSLDAVRSRVRVDTPAYPVLDLNEVQLSQYDALLGQEDPASDDCPPSAPPLEASG